MCNGKECKCGGKCEGGCKCKHSSKEESVETISKENKKHLVFYIESETMILDNDIIGMYDNKLSQFIKRSQLDKIDYEFKTIRFNNNMMKTVVKSGIENIDATYEALETFEKKYNIQNIAEDINTIDEAIEKFDQLISDLIESVDGLIILTSVEDDYKPSCAVFNTVPLYLASLGIEGKLVFI